MARRSGRSSTASKPSLRVSRNIVSMVDRLTPCPAGDGFERQVALSDPCGLGRHDSEDGSFGFAKRAANCGGNQPERAHYANLKLADNGLAACSMI